MLKKKSDNALTASELSPERAASMFREAEGLVPLPRQLKPKEISREMRVKLWDLFSTVIGQTTTPRPLSLAFLGESSPRDLGHPWDEILYDYHSEIMLEFSEDFDCHWTDGFHLTLRKLFNAGSYGDLFEFIQFALRHPKCPRGVAKQISEILVETKSAYRLLDRPPTLVPLTSPEVIKSVQQALQKSDTEKFSAARQHLIKSAHCLTSGDESGAIREAIHAVESVAKIIDGDAKTTLAPALKRIEAEQGALHPSLRLAFEKLYGYTSDKDGIRHASLNVTDANVGEDEATFMYAACSIFVSYLIGKAAKIGS